MILIISKSIIPCLIVPIHTVVNFVVSTFKLWPFTPALCFVDTHLGLWVPFKLWPFTPLDEKYLFDGVLWAPFKLCPFTPMNRIVFSMHQLWAPFKLWPFTPIDVPGSYFELWMPFNILISSVLFMVTSQTIIDPLKLSPMI